MTGNPLVWCLLAILLACTNPRRSPDTSGGRQDTASIQGIVTKVERGEVLVEVRPWQSVGSDKARVRLTSGTRITRRSGASATLTDLRVGERVRAWFVGPVLASFPAQATASLIVIEGWGP